MRGFTLIELLIVIGILILIAGIAGFTASGFRSGQTHLQAHSIIRDAVRQARIYAEQGRNDESWIVSFTANTVTITGAQSNEQESFTLPTPSSISLQSGNSVTFLQPFGFSQTPLTLTLTTGNTQSDYSINAYGILAQQ